MSTKLRAPATNGFEKDFFKLMNSSILAKRWRIFATTKTGA